MSVVRSRPWARSPLVFREHKETAGKVPTVSASSGVIFSQDQGATGLRGVNIDRVQHVTDVARVEHKVLDIHIGPGQKRYVEVLAQGLQRLGREA